MIELLSIAHLTASITYPVRPLLLIRTWMSLTTRGRGGCYMRHGSSVGNAGSLIVGVNTISFTRGFCVDRCCEAKVFISHQDVKEGEAT